MPMTEAQLAPWVASSTSVRTNTVTSASFTPTPGSLVVACTGSGNQAGVTVTGISLTDSVGEVWRRLVWVTAGGQFADASVWVKDAGVKPQSQTVTVTMSPSGVLDVGVAVREFRFALPAVLQNGKTATATGTLASLNITPGSLGSEIVGAWGNASTSAATALASTSIYGQTNDSGGATEGAFEATALATVGVGQTLGFTASFGGSGFAVAEILSDFVNMGFGARSA